MGEEDDDGSDHKVNPPFEKRFEQPIQTLNGIEILCHNLSHSDLVLSVNDHLMSHPNGCIIARPGFSYFREISRKVVHGIANEHQLSQVPTLSYPKYSRQRNTQVGQYPAMEDDERGDVPVGFDLRTTSVPINDLSVLRFRGDDKSLLQDAVAPGCVIEATFFPLIAVLLPKWLVNCDPSKQKIVFIISGRGTPNDSRSLMIDNSTKFTGVLIKKFIEREYPLVKVMHIHSTTNIFRYDENIAFVKRELLPMIDVLRDDLARKVGARWKDIFKLTLSFADGSSARISAINAALKPYRPNYMHFWQLKTFWNETKVCDDDIECHSFEEVATDPAVKIDQTESTVRLVVAEIIRFKEEFELIRNDQSIETDLSSFWLRKTKKPVLAVLLVQKPGGRPKLYRGTNMEVSMPTGSLCAERNVIGSALADDLTLRRQDLKVIAVYSVGSLDSGSSEGKRIYGKDRLEPHNSEDILSSSGGNDMNLDEGTWSGSQTLESSPIDSNNTSRSNSYTLQPNCRSSGVILSSDLTTLRKSLESSSKRQKGDTAQIKTLDNNGCEDTQNYSEDEHDKIPFDNSPMGYRSQSNSIYQGQMASSSTFSAETTGNRISSEVAPLTLSPSVLLVSTSNERAVEPLGAAAGAARGTSSISMGDDVQPIINLRDIPAFSLPSPAIDASKVGNTSLLAADCRRLITAGKRSYSVDSVWVMGMKPPAEGERERNSLESSPNPWPNGDLKGSLYETRSVSVSGSSISNLFTTELLGDNEREKKDKNAACRSWNATSNSSQSPIGRKRAIMDIPITWPYGVGSGRVGQVRTLNSFNEKKTESRPNRADNLGNCEMKKPRGSEFCKRSPSRSPTPASSKLTRRVSNGVTGHPSSLIVWENNKSIPRNKNNCSADNQSGSGGGSSQTGCNDIRSSERKDAAGRHLMGADTDINYPNSFSLCNQSGQVSKCEERERTAVGRGGENQRSIKRSDSLVDEDLETPFACSSHCLRAVTTITVDEGDMNPLKPCGACTEWLKKIAEVNPAFAVVTFTDANCTGVYVEQIKD